MFTVHRLGLRQLELNKKHHLHYTFQGNAGMSCNTAVFRQLRLSALKLHIALVGPEEIRNFGFLTSRAGPTQKKKLCHYSIPLTTL